MTYLLVALVVLQLLDAATTYYAVAKLGLTEANPVVRGAIEKLGLVPALALSKGAVFAVLYLCPMPLWLYGLLVALYVVVVGNNAYHIKKQAGA